MKKTSLLSLTLASAISALSLPAIAGSDIWVQNNSSQPLQAVWQAGGCSSAEKDWWGDTQWSMCKMSVLQPGEEGRYSFNFLMSDRSVKIFVKGRKERVGYCNSMDDESLTVSDDGNGNFTTTGC